MKNGFELNLNGRKISTSWLQKKHEKFEPGEFSEQEYRALMFCAKWLAGEQTFQVQTSGSTGAPKCLEITRSRMEASAAMTARALGLDSGDSALVCLNCKHIGGLMMLARGLYLGLRLFVVEPERNPIAALRDCCSGCIDLTAVVPLQLAAMLGAGQSEFDFLNNMKVILVGGAPVSRALQQKLQHLITPVFQTFGMTETVSHIALRRLNGQESSATYKALPGVNIALDNLGCLKINATVTDDAWLTTNDMVEMTAPGEFTWLGRFDNVINSGGVKVCAEEVERVIAAGIAEMGLSTPPCYFVTGIQDDKLGEKVIAVFEGEILTVEVEASLRSYLASKLIKYKLPKAYLSLPIFCRVGNGKIDKSATLEKMGI